MAEEQPRLFEPKIADSEPAAPAVDPVKAIQIANETRKFDYDPNKGNRKPGWATYPDAESDNNSSKSSDDAVTPLPLRTEGEGSRGSFPDDDGGEFQFAQPAEGHETAYARGVAAARDALQAARERDSQASQ